ncbi:hypothetical protein D9756_008002 [Leucocoprinus leucothites]|uniref:Uncharacterized protein n=1 Tax=Leucocoprinus leucothites TaxID=201217 RepID=A0A8H5D4B9_9AGAR|nr:hypothetical protein D9756_008002 [Leucoagaricus leucothites]
MMYQSETHKDIPILKSCASQSLLSLLSVLSLALLSLLRLLELWLPGALRNWRNAKAAPVVLAFVTRPASAALSMANAAVIETVVTLVITAGSATLASMVAARRA